RAKTAIQKDAAASATVQGDVLRLVAVNDEVLHAGSFQIVAADDGEDGGSLGLVRNHTVCVQWRVDGKSVAALAGDSAHRGVEAAGIFVPNGDAVADLKTFRLE